MNNRIARVLSWVVAVLCANYIGWECYYLKRLIPVLAQLLAGVGEELPAYTRFVIALTNHILLVGSLLIILVVGKELVIRDTIIKLEITFIVFLSAAWVFDFAAPAVLEPAFHIMGRIR
jgi:type II secretory pathway component PulF